MNLIKVIGFLLRNESYQILIGIVGWIPIRERVASESAIGRISDIEFIELRGILNPIGEEEGGGTGRFRFPLLRVPEIGEIGQILLILPIRVHNKDVAIAIEPVRLKQDLLSSKPDRVIVVVTA